MLIMDFQKVYMNKYINNQNESTISKSAFVKITRQ